MLAITRRFLFQHQRQKASTTSLYRGKFTVCIEGNIGSGKTTFLEYFKQFPNIIEVNGEPVQKWRNFEGFNPLAHIYDNPERWAFTVQMFIMSTLLEQHKKPQLKPVRLMERSVYSSRYCFVENQYQKGLMSDMEYAILSKAFDWSVNSSNFKIDLIVYLRTKPEIVYERILARQRPEEQTIKMHYLQSLHSLHEAWLIDRESFPIPAPVLVVDANKDKSSMLQTFQELKSKILFGYDTKVSSCGNGTKVSSNDTKVSSNDTKVS